MTCLILPNGYLHSIRSSAILPLQGAADGPTRKSRIVKYLQITLLPVKSPVQSLDYRANSYHIFLSILGFHGYGEVISQIYPCPFRPINSSFSGTPSPSHHSTAPTLLLWQRRCSRAPRTPAKAFLHQSRSFQPSSLRGKWPSTSPSLRLVHHPLSHTFTMSWFICHLFY